MIDFWTPLNISGHNFIDLTFYHTQYLTNAIIDTENSLRNRPIFVFHFLVTDHLTFQRVYSCQKSKFIYCSRKSIMLCN